MSVDVVKPGFSFFTARKLGFFTLAKTTCYILVFQSQLCTDTAYFSFLIPPLATITSIIIITDLLPILFAKCDRLLWFCHDI